MDSFLKHLQPLEGHKVRLEKLSSHKDTSNIPIGVVFTGYFKLIDSYNRARVLVGDIALSNYVQTSIIEGVSKTSTGFEFHTRNSVYSLKEINANDGKTRETL